MNQFILKQRGQKYISIFSLVALSLQAIIFIIKEWNRIGYIRILNIYSLKGVQEQAQHSIWVDVGRIDVWVSNLNSLGVWFNYQCVEINLSSGAVSSFMVIPYGVQM